MDNVMLFELHAFPNGSINNIKSIFNLKKSLKDVLGDFLSNCFSYISPPLPFLEGSH